MSHVNNIFKLQPAGCKETEQTLIQQQLQNFWNIEEVQKRKNSQRRKKSVKKYYKKQ